MSIKMECVILLDPILISRILQKPRLPPLFRFLLKSQNDYPLEFGSSSYRLGFIMFNKILEAWGSNGIVQKFGTVSVFVFLSYSVILKEAKEYQIVQFPCRSIQKLIKQLSITFCIREKNNKLNKRQLKCVCLKWHCSFVDSTQLLPSLPDFYEIQ